MSQRVIRSYKSGKHLLKRLTNNPALPTFVKSLDSKTLGKVIQEIGVEDSALLVEFSSPDQMVALVDNTVWRNDLPGAPETFQGEEFLRWLEVMLEVGDEFCAERLQALGDDLLATAFSHFLQVGGPGEDLPSSAEAAELYGPFVVRPIEDDQWDVLYAMLNTLYENEPELLQTMLLRCCLPPGHTRGANTAEQDAMFEHELGRESQGFVTPESARVFLTAARSARLDALAQESDYDLETARYFRSVEPARTPPANEAGMHEGEQSDTQTDDITRTPTEDDIAELEQAVREIELLDRNDRPTLLLAGPDELSNATALQRAMAAVQQSDPHAAALRLAEGAYLSNVMMSGATLAGRRISESEAAAVVAATCNLGFDYVAEADLAKAPGLVRLFRIGWHIVQTIPLDTARRLATLLQSVDASVNLRGWMVVEIRDIVASEAFLADIASGTFDAVRETLEMLPLIMAEDRASEFEALINDTPRLLAYAQNSEDVVPSEMRFIATLDDLDQIDLVVTNAREDLTNG